MIINLQNARVHGYVKWHKEKKTINQSTGEQKTVTDYSIVLIDTAKHGIDVETKETAITRASVKIEIGDNVSETPAGASRCLLEGETVQQSESQSDGD